jgi:hypothetical protein
MPVELLAELARQGITLVADGGRLRFHPRAAMTPELAERLKSRKAEVLEVVNNPWPANHTEPEPCPQCGGWELWQSILTGRWRCMTCDPPEKARAWLAKAERIKRRY